MGCLTLRSDLVLLTTVALSMWCTTIANGSLSTNRSIANSYGNSLSTRQTGRWQTDPFSSCSVPCGGGQQHRLIRCVQEDLRNPEVLTEIATVLCPSPMPNVTQSCNTQMCMGKWKVEPWSPCSVTCGEGVQSRLVTCENHMWKGHHFQVSDEECGGKSPNKYRKCFVRDCPSTRELLQGSILAENYTLFQIRRAGMLKIIVGGKVMLLPGQTVMVKCPTRQFSRRLIYWSKGNKMIPHNGRVKVTAVGLRIQKADPKQDRGIYTCMAGQRKATINIQFTRKRNPKLGNYRQWAKKYNRRFRRRNPSLRDKGQQEGSKFGKVVSYIRNGHQQDQSLNTTNNLSFVTGNWTECSVTCGSRGVRQRKVFCAQVNSKFVKMVDDDECFNMGVTKPRDVKRCVQGPADCPVWRPGPWSKCDPRCGDGVGRRSRILLCEWEKSGKPAWNACDLARKPVVRKPCKPTPCPKTCEDSSPKCRRVRQFKMCRFRHFRDKCCHSCQEFHHPNSIFSRVINNRIDNSYAK